MSGQETESGPATTKSKAASFRFRLSGWSANLLGLGVCALLFAAFFHKSIFFGKPIARLGMLDKVDAFVNPSIKQAMVAFGADPSGYLIFFPWGLFAARTWSEILPPVWNPDTGLGYPALADPQLFIFSPAHLLGLFSSPEAYNAGLLLELFLSLAGMFLLCRGLRLSLPASFLAATSYSFCPRILSEVDLSGAECAYPWMLLAFVWLSRNPAPLKVVFTGTLIGLMPYSVHPETSFFCALYGSMLYGFLRVLSPGGGATVRKIAACAGEICVMALTACAVSAPLLLPFFEYMGQAFFYKEAGTAGGGLLSENFTAALLAAQGTAPPFLGAGVVLLALVGAMVSSPAARALVLTFLASVILTVPPPPLAQVMSLKPFSYVATLYGLPELLIFLSLLAGVGLDALKRRESSRVMWIAMSLCGVAMFGVLGCVILDRAHLLSSPELVERAFQMYRGSFLLLLAGVLGTLVLAAVSRAAGIWGALSLWGIVALNFGLQSTISRTALPVQDEYRVGISDELAAVKFDESRFIACGSNFFLPNTALNHSMRDLRTFSPILPLRYRKFLEAAGAVSHNLYFMDMPESCSPLLGLASVQYVITRTACSEAGFGAGGNRSEVACLANQPVVPGVRIISSSFYFDRVNRQVDGRLKLRVHEGVSDRLSLVWNVVDQSGKVIWESPQTLLNRGAPREREIDVHVPLPPNAHGDGVFLELSVFDTWTGRQLDSSAVKNAVPQGRVRIAHIAPDSGGGEKSRFRLLAQTKDGVRLYKNGKAVPEAYLVTRTMRVNREEEILHELRNADFPSREVIVVEDELPALLKKTAEQVEEADVEIRRPDGRTVVIKTNYDGDAYLVLTDLFYPGWECFVDQKLTPVHRANYLFRAVYVPGGSHEVRFQFSSKSQEAGLWAALICLTTVWLVALMKFTRRDKG